ncbi:hypothetical protein OPV22_028519 [Ensete ventricosum]|uniref:Uncharacterized protein n=1 Tax=Ensete ventricosum TaxID=4639 RepID=A0AAV8PYM0_ENSVE|nr:hypothetical protein OPV22_028519 [Ensete ventricosum]
MYVALPWPPMEVLRLVRSPARLPRERARWAAYLRRVGDRAEGFSDWVETEECVAACWLDRGTVGISSDALLEADFMRKLCSPDCYYHGCPNVLDLYFNLAAAEGAFLPSLCEARRGECSPRNGRDRKQGMLQSVEDASS